MVENIFKNKSFFKADKKDVMNPIYKENSKLLNVFLQTQGWQHFHARSISFD